MKLNNTLHIVYNDPEAHLCHPGTPAGSGLPVTGTLSLALLFSWLTRVIASTDSVVWDCTKKCIKRVRMVIICDCIYHFINNKDTIFCQTRLLVSQIASRMRSYYFRISLILKQLRAVGGSRVGSPGFILIMKKQIGRLYLILPISSIFKWYLLKFYCAWVHFSLSIQVCE